MERLVQEGSACRNPFCARVAMSRPFERAHDLLAQADLRPTRQRVALAHLLFQGADRHVTADQLHSEACSRDMKVSVATVYNFLNQMTANGLLREVVVEVGRSYFDTNTAPHHHFFDQTTGWLSDVSGPDVVVQGLPSPPPGKQIARVDVIIRLVAGS